MCGIAGIWHKDERPVASSLLSQFTNSLAHRGPDGGSTYIHKTIGLGHRRLAIVDRNPLSAQPMGTRDGRFWITFNGEIYNHHELRSELLAEGYEFATASDTEVVLAAYRKWGVQCQTRFNGMWAFAIWDNDSQTLFLSRDRFGVKPLFYAVTLGSFYFASELKAFLALPELPLAFNDDVAANALLSMVSIDAAGDTLLKNVHSLCPGHYLFCTKAASLVKPVRWWRTYDHLPDIPSRFNAQVEAFHDLFASACRVRSEASVPFASTVSGGLDSSSVICMLSETGSTRPQQVFHTFFPGTSINESRFARAASAQASLPLVEAGITLSEVLAHLDETLFSFESIHEIPSARWLHYRTLRQHGFCLSIEGDGGDELLAGYPHYASLALRSPLWPRASLSRTFQLWQLCRTLNSDRKASLASAMASAYAASLRGYFSRYFPAAKRWKDQWMPPTLQARWLSHQPKALPLPAFQEDQSFLRKKDPLYRRQYWDVHYAILPTILRGVDRCSMAHGIEVREPFLDYRLVCFAMALPQSSKLGNGFTKLILREAMKGKLPEAVRNRKDKLGFFSPLSQWLKNPLMKDFILDHLRSQDFAETPLWRGKRIASEVETFFKEEKWGLASASWPFVQAMLLRRLFLSRKRELASSFAGRAQPQSKPLFLCPSHTS